jgi:hypothetical protein
VNHVTRRREEKMMSKAAFFFVLLRVWALPVSGPGDIRCKAWHELITGTRGERENLILRCQGRNASGYNRKRQSTDAEYRGGASHSSDECSVIGLERRGCLISSYYTVNRQREEQDG